MFVLAVLLAVSVCSPGARGEAMPTYGLSLEGPKDWQRLSRDMGKRVARWAILDSNGQISQLIQIDSGRGIDKSIEAAAAAIAKKFGGTVSKDRVTVDEVPALRVDVPHVGKGLQPVEVLVVARDELTYFVFGATAQPGSVRDAIEQIRKSWKWTKRIAPLDALRDRVKMNMPELGICVMAPTCAAFVPGRDNAASLHLAFRDPAKDYDELLILTQTPPMSPGTDLAAVSTTFRDGWNARGLTEGNLAWETNEIAKSRLVISNIVAAKETPEEATKRQGRPQRRVIWALRQLDEESLLLINVTVMSDDPKEIDRYAKYLEEYARAVEKIPRGQ